MKQSAGVSVDLIDITYGDEYGVGNVVITLVSEVICYLVTS
jgi:hypothetical protein